MPSALSNPESQARLLHLATTASLATALVLVAAKLGGWWLTESVSLLSSLLDSSTDLIASLLTFLAVRWSLVPPDHDHRFGHGKAEALAALAQSMFILGSAVMLSLQGLDRLIHPQPLKQNDIGLAVMVFSIALTLALVTFQYSVARRTGSTAIRADALHYATDLLSGFAVIAALFLSQWGLPRADAVIGLLIAGVVARSAVQIARDALDQLMDRELPAAIGEQVRTLALGVSGVRGIASLRTRQSGCTYFFEVYVVLDDTIPLRDAHDIGDKVRAAIEDAFPGADILIHEEPAGALGTSPHSAAQ
ncbi:MAG: cation diffusion facilitator family transporter [Halothiobacillaceae bacterium]